jgi:phage gp16-like protein
VAVMVESTESADRHQATEKRRKALVAKVKIAQKQLGMDDDTYRDFLEGVAGPGKRSASILKVWELDNVMKAFRAKGFKNKPAKSAGTRPQADDDQSRLIRSLWLQLHEAGKVRDPGERALVHWVRGQLKTSDGIEAIQWLSVRQKRRIIEQLKQWLAR